MNLMSKEFWKRLCTPAKIYMAIAVIAAIVFLLNGIAMVTIVMKLLFATIWTFILDWLCKKGYTSLSWFLVLLPYIIIALAVFEVYHISEEHKQILRNLQLQGAYGQEPFTENMGAPPSSAPKIPMPMPPMKKNKK